LATTSATTYLGSRIFHHAVQSIREAISREFPGYTGKIREKIASQPNLSVEVKYI
jgi:hypothetical protein